MGFLKVMSSLQGNENNNNKQKCGDIESKNRHLTTICARDLRNRSHTSGSDSYALIG